MGNETTKTPKPPKYILQDGYLYERVPKKRVKEAMEEYVDLQEMLIVASGGKIKPSADAIKEVEKNNGSELK